MGSLIHDNQASAGRHNQPPQSQISLDMDPDLYKAASEGNYDALPRRHNPHMDLDLYKAASKGNFNAFCSNLNALDLVLTPRNNTILHVYITAQTKLTNDSKELIQQNPRSRNSFLEQVLCHCPSLLTKPNIKNETPLHIAARYGHYDIILVLATHRDQDTESEVLSNFWRMITKTNETALHEAARNNHIQVVQLLLEKDPELINMCNDARETPLYIAMERGYQKVSSMILERCFFSAAAYDGPCKRTVLHAAVIREDAAYDGPFKRTVLHAAVIRKDAVMTKKILEATLGLMTGRVDEEGWTPLHYASFFASLKIAKLLLKFDKSAAYIQDLEGRTPLLVAATPRRHGESQRLSAEVMNLIISKCPDCSELVDSSGRNVLHLAAESFNDLAMRALLQAPYLFNLINEKDTEGNTPFHVLANVGCNCTNLVRHRLLDSMAVNDSGFTAVDIIETSEFEDNIDKVESKINIQKVDKYWGSWRRKLQLEPLQDAKKRIDKMINEYKTGRDAHLVVATLIATVTFAAGFTLPGGLESDDPKDNDDPMKKGYAVLSRRFAFKVFLLTDNITFLLSMSVIFMHFLLAVQGNKRKIYWLTFATFWILPGALLSLAVAFSTAMYVVLPRFYTVTIMNFVMTAIAILIWQIVCWGFYHHYQVKEEDKIILSSSWYFLFIDSQVQIMSRFSSFFRRKWDK